ncbi:MAG: hypothetical protein WA542_04285 [Candidatus Acidiferrum sp.]
MRGRKPAYESRAVEFRQRLSVWKRTPESSRPSLRALARELGTSHQMLAYLNNGLDSWQAEETARRIRARAKAEGREMTLRECCEAIIRPGFFRRIEELRQAAKRGPLNHWQVQELKLCAKRGFPGAQEVLQNCRQMTPEEEKQARAAERKAIFASAVINHIARIKQEAERGSLPWRDVEILKMLTRSKCVEAKELLQKYRKSAEPRPQAPQ